MFCQGCGKSLKEGNRDGSGQKRLMFLPFWLVLMFIGAVYLIFFGSSYGVSLFVVLGVLQIVGVFAVGFERIWGFYLIVGLAVISLVFNLMHGLAFFSILGLLGPIVLYLAMKPVWGRFR